jgi:hypothetical protein
MSAMTSGKFAALVLVFLVAAAGWMVLGGSVSYRQHATEDTLRPQVEALWGQPLAQAAPIFATQAKALPEGEATRTGSKPSPPPPLVSVEPERNTITADFHHEFRRKGLLWYRTYEVTFDAVYEVRNESEDEVLLYGDVRLPAARQTYDNFAFQVNDEKPGRQPDPQNGIWRCAGTVAPGEVAKVRLHYRTRGLDRWSYQLAQDAACVRNLSLTMTTDFGGFDFPLTSPTTKPVQTAGGYQFAWQYETLLSGLEIALDMPTRLNPGPLASRISFFAPVGLLFFFLVMVLIGVVRDRNLHPMHYLFVCAAFFAFHLLFSYLVDVMEINKAFLLSAAVSVFLVATYVSRFMGPRFTFVAVVPAQVLFLVLFSYAFFFQGYTGLTITIASIVTLAVMMQLTARIDWDRKLRGGPPQAPTGAPSTPPVPPATPQG